MPLHLRRRPAITPALVTFLRRLDTCLISLPLFLEPRHAVVAHAHPSPQFIHPAPPPPRLPPRRLKVLERRVRRPVAGAKVGGVTTRELVRLEVEVLKCLRWQLEWEMGEVEEVAEALCSVAKEKGLLPDGQDAAKVDDDEATPLTPTSPTSPFSPDYFSIDRPSSPPLRPLTPTPPTTPLSPALSSTSRSSLDAEEAAEEEQWQALLAGKISRKPSLNKKLAARGGPSQPGKLQRIESCETVKLREGVAGLSFGEVGKVRM